MCCIVQNLTVDYPGTDSRKRTIVHLMDDISDIQLFSNVFKMSDLYQQTTCSICCEDFMNNDEVRILPCNHYYHNNCIQEWLTKNPSCPMCRQQTSQV